jgi:hypothetical protein
MGGTNGLIFRFLRVALAILPPFTPFEAIALWVVPESEEPPKQVLLQDGGRFE